ncbi:flagellar biosynthesis protein FlgA [Micromonospora sp. IBHARD004]|uniref:flagellar biosynthesis protein FlgA n=1 Tax=Micromonospora sp. IBHARD004 TaxID=3457764 RepID=UPI0040586CD5
MTLVAMLLGLAAAVLRIPSGCPPGAAPAALGPTPSDSPAATPPGSPGGALPLPDGAVGVPVRLAEPAALAVLRPGARVDLLVVPAGGAAGAAVLVAARALVLDVVGADAVDGSSALYLALRPEQAQRAVGLPEGSRFAVVVRG